VDHHVIGERLKALTETDFVGPSEFYDDYERQLHAKLITLGPSDVHGIGVFARRALPQGACVGAMHGPRVEPPEPGDTNDYLFVQTQDGAQHFEDLTGPLRFLNSGVPNVIVRRHNGRTRVFTITDVAPGGELLMDYNSKAETVS
jgi:SET domain-containing protein